MITDRYVDSSLAYQGAGRALTVAEVERCRSWATDGLLPDLTIVLDVDPTIGLGSVRQHRRIDSSPNRLTFHQTGSRAVSDAWPSETPSAISCSTPGQTSTRFTRRSVAAFKERLP